MRPLFANVFDFTYIFFCSIRAALLQIVLNREHLAVEFALVIVIYGLLGMLRVLVLDSSGPKEQAKVGVIKSANRELADPLEKFLKVKHFTYPDLVIGNFLVINVAHLQPGGGELELWLGRSLLDELDGEPLRLVSSVVVGLRSSFLLGIDLVMLLRGSGLLVDNLSLWLKIIRLASLMLIAITVILLMGFALAHDFLVTQGLASKFLVTDGLLLEILLISFNKLIETTILVEC